MKKINILLISTILTIENILFIPNNAKANTNFRETLAEIGFYSSVGGTIIACIGAFYKIIKNCYENCCKINNINNTVNDNEEPETILYTNSDVESQFNNQNNEQKKLSENKNSSNNQLIRTKTAPISKVTIFDEV